MITVYTFQAGNSSQTTDSHQLLPAPHLSLPYLMGRPGAGVPGNFKKLCPQLFSIYVGYMASQLRDTGHYRPAGSYIHPVSPAGSIINLPQPAVGELGHNPPQNTVIIKCPGYNIQAGGIQVFLIGLSQRGKDKLPIPIIQIKTQRLCNVPQFRIRLLDQGICDLLQLGIFFIRDKLHIGFLVYLLIPDVFPLDHLIIQLHHLRRRCVQCFFYHLLNILRGISQNPQPVDLPVRCAGDFPCFPDSPDNILQDPHFQIRIFLGDLPGQLFLVFPVHGITPSPGFAPEDWQVLHPLIPRTIWPGILHAASPPCSHPGGPAAALPFCPR